ncbi:MAG: glutamine--tRNA ligase/YqeY domain fusion protein [Deltaproteobacteria bacterium]|nr:glutamine--tRNA ligase/YqeY domain fusion protein [Deltaproteobacteria bacterium]
MEAKPTNFIREIIDADVASGKHKEIVTRFPPEPNGYLHIGHAKSICINFGIARDYGGRCHLRMDDTNPTKEEREYIESIQTDVRWLGFDWGPHEYYASDYYQQIYEHAVGLVREGKAFVCHLNADQMREYRGTLTEPGKQSPYRERSVEENLDLFARMKNGEFSDGHCVLRAKIDMTSPNMNMRDPVIFRILRASHPRTGDAWCVYPMYDFAHPLSDAFEGVTHSICTLEFEDHRPLYDWVVRECRPVGGTPRQIEFARLNLSYTVMSKRKLLRLVKDGLVSGWDDPRMPTIQGMRRRGYPPTALRAFADRVGVAKRESTVDLALLEYCVREDLNKTAPRVMAVLNPLKVVITNYPAGETEQLEAVNNPEDPAAGKRQVPFSREIFIEREDFMENPPPKFFRLAPGREVRLRYAYFIKCAEAIKNAAGEVTELRCTYDPATRGGDAPDGRKVKATLHWVDAGCSLAAEVRLYDKLFTRENPEAGPEGTDFSANLNPDSLKVLSDCRVEPHLAAAQPESRWQFERLGYFCVDNDSAPGKLVFNRTVTLKDEWAKIQKRGA